MNSEPRFRVISALNARTLNQQVRELEQQGWAKVGPAAIAVPSDEHRPPYLCQTMYLAVEPQATASLAERFEGHTKPTALT